MNMFDMLICSARTALRQEASYCVSQKAKYDWGGDTASKDVIFFKTFVSWIEIVGFDAGPWAKSALEAGSAYNKRSTFSDLGRRFFGLACVAFS